MRLNEIEYLRPILFIQLFLVHAFTIYTTTSWEIPAGIENIKIYDWIAKVAYSCMLELFTFISGYVYYFVSLKKNMGFLRLVYTKFKRLIIPSILFSILFYLLLMEPKEFDLSLLYEIICGEGHLWYLPMLFGCFLLGYMLKNTKYPLLVLMMEVVVSAFSRFPNIFRVSQIAYYFSFFYMGMFICRYREIIQDIVTSRKNCAIIISGILYIVGLIVLLPICVQLKEYHYTTWIEGYLVSAMARFTNIVYATLGIVFWYIISLRVADVLAPPFWIKQFNILSMGVYVVHQFILMFLYYYTELPRICGSYSLPWVAIIIALPSSVLLSYLVRQTKIGKSLI